MRSTFVNFCSLISLFKLKEFVRANLPFFLVFFFSIFDRSPVMCNACIFASSPIVVKSYRGGSAIRYAILTFHTIIADKSVDNRNVERARDAGALQAVAHFLDRETNEKLLSVLVECVRLLCDKSHSQKVMNCSSLMGLLALDSDVHLGRMYKCPWKTWKEIPGCLIRILWKHLLKQ